MDNYKELYYYLFNRITDLIEEMKSIQQTSEEMFINFKPDNEDNTTNFPQRN